MSTPADDPLPEAVALVEGAASAGAAGGLGWCTTQHSR